MLPTSSRFKGVVNSKIWLFIGRLVMVVAVTAAFLLSGIQSAETQGFSSGSNGSDGPLDLTTPGTILFDPRSFNPPLDPDGDNVFHFTTINIAAGVTVKLSGKIFTGPVFWLASGAVTINGFIDLSGENGHDATTVPSVRAPSIPGAGGYAGGVGGRTTPPASPQPGNGPGGGAAGDPSIDSGVGRGGNFTGNQFLVPLVGGSGGGGSLLGGSFSTSFSPGGGAGGGAILIASSVSIALNGTGQIRADGGAGLQNLAGGSGGAIRLMAPVITGNGVLSALGGNRSLVGLGRAGADGRIRIEAFQHLYSFNANNPLSQGSPFNVFLPSTQTSVRVVSIAGIAVPPNPMGSFTMPDVTINQGAAVTIAIEARGIPLGTVVKLHLYSENGPDQFVDTSPLAGTLQLSTATAQVTFPSGFTRGFARATWTQ